MAIEHSRRRSTGLVFGLSSLLVLMLLCCVIFAVWRASRECQAESILRIHREPVSGIVAGNQRYARFKETQVSLLKSPVVLAAAAKHPRLAAILAKESDPVRYLEERVQVDGVAGSELIRVRLRGDDPATMEIVLDGVVDAYLTFIDEEVAWQRDTLELVSSLVSIPDGKDIDRTELRSRLEALPHSFVKDSLISSVDGLEGAESLEVILEDFASMERMLSKPRVQVIQRATVPTRPWP